MSDEKAWKVVSRAIAEHAECSADATTGEWIYTCDCGEVMPAGGFDKAEDLHIEHQARAVLAAANGLLAANPPDVYGPVEGDRCGQPDPDDSTLACHRAPFHSPHAVDNADGRHVWLDSYEGPGLVDIFGGAA